jgi:phosphatidylglycerophosphate synthase
MPPFVWLDRWLTVHSSLLVLSGVLSLYFFDLKFFFLGATFSFGMLGWQAVRKLSRSQWFTLANIVTGIRLGMIGIIPIWAGDPFQLAMVGLVILCLDGLDGYLARRMKQTSPFGASFDAETDAFFAATLSLLLYWQGIVDAWILIPGFLRYLYHLPIQFLKNPDQEPFRFPLAKTIAVLFLGTLLAAWVLPAAWTETVLGLSSLALLFSFWLEFRHDVLVPGQKASPLLPGEDRTIFLFWGGFLFANGFLFLPTFLSYMDSGILPGVQLDIQRPALDAVFIQTQNDLLRLCGEWVVLTLLLVALRKRKRVFRPLVLLIAAFFITAFIFQSYQTLYFKLYGIPPKLEVDLVLIREVMPIFLSSIGADRFFNVLISLLAIVGMILLFAVGFRSWTKAIQRLPTTRHIPIILGFFLLFGGLRVAFYHSYYASPLAFRAHWLTPRIAESFFLADSQRLVHLDRNIPYREYRDQPLVDTFPSVYLLFVEAYGAVATLSDTTEVRYQELAQSLETQLAENGWMARSTYSHAPILGGRSWLSFTSALSGIYINNQIHYNNLIYSNPVFPHWPDVMNHLGFETYRMTTMRTNPKTDTLIPHELLQNFWKFDHFIDYGQIPYEGPEYDYFGGIPDQYAMGYFRDSILPNTSDPHFLFFITMTSHTPWYPPPPIQDTWQELDRDTTTTVNLSLEGAKIDRYFQSIEYELKVLTQHIVQGPDDAIYILVGDHQPAALEYLLWGKFPEDAVPLHIISRDTLFLETFTGFDPGLHIDTAQSKRIRHEALYSTFMNRYLQRYGDATDLPGVQEYGVSPPDPLPDGEKIR